MYTDNATAWSRPLSRLLYRIHMPELTFNNLSEDRKKEILNVSFEEFALSDYESASLANIIKKLDIAKGSFYRYFKNKSDLYFYLSQFADAQVAINFSRHFDNSGGDFFQDWTNFIMSLSGIEETYPMLLRFRFRAAFEQSREVTSIQNKEKHQDRTRIISNMIRTYQEKGMVSKEIDLDFLSLLMVFYNFAISEYINLKYEIPENSPIYPVNKTSYMQDIVKCIDMIKRGVKA